MDHTYKHDDEAAEFNTVTESGNITVSQGHEFIKQLTLSALFHQQVTMRLKLLQRLHRHACLSESHDAVRCACCSQTPEGLLQYFPSST